MVDALKLNTKNKAPGKCTKTVKWCTECEIKIIQSFFSILRTMHQINQIQTEKKCCFNFMCVWYFIAMNYIDLIMNISFEKMHVQAENFVFA